MPNDDKQQTTSAPPIIFSEDALPPMPDLNTTNSGSAAPADDIIMPVITTSSTPKKKFAGGKIIATILGLFLLVGGVGAGVYLVQQNQNINEKAWTKESCESQDAILCPHPDYKATFEAGRINKEGLLEECYCAYIGGGGGGGGSGGNPTSGTCPNGNPFNNQCVIIYCPNGDTDGKNGCEIPDTNAWYGPRHTCGTKTFGANECGQVDPVDDNGVYCQLSGWKYDIKLSSCSGPWPPTVPPTAPAITAVCQNIKAYSPTWTLLTNNQLSALTTGSQVNFCVAGSATGGSFNKAKFTINGAVQPETTTVRPTSTDFCQLYTIPAATNTFNVTAQINHVTLGWK